MELPQLLSLVQAGRALHDPQEARLYHQFQIQLSRLGRVLTGTPSDANIVDAATALRVLYHHTRSSHSLAEQLGGTTTLAFNNLTTGTGFTTEPVRPEDYGVANAPKDIQFLKFVSAGPPNPPMLSFEDWWAGTPVVTLHGENGPITRRKLVLAITNQDGGAHVDPSTAQWYDRLVGYVGNPKTLLGDLTGTPTPDTLIVGNDAVPMGQFFTDGSYNRLGYVILARIALEGLNGATNLPKGWL
jgi:hypothetical protein